MTRICLATTGPESWKAGLADPARQWRKGFSAMAAAHSWERAQATRSGLSPEIAAVLPEGVELQLALVEHKVPLPGGGRPSQCDVFALVRAGAGGLSGAEGLAVAVEAKVDESFGPTIAEWLAEPSPGKRLRLSALCGWLGVPGPPPPGLRYQLLHRTGAAIVEARRFDRPVAAMLVQSFSPTRRWFADYAAFAALLGLKAAPGQAAETALPSGLRLRLGWACAARPTGQG